MGGGKIGKESARGEGGDDVQKIKKAVNGLNWLCVCVFKFL